MKQATLIFVRDGNKILLGMKKRGFGAGRFNGFGGKVEPNETPEQGVVRELTEESGITASEVKKHAVLNFSFANKPDWNQVVHVFIAQSWSGSPVESEEMKPEWFEHSSLPFEKMWPDDPFWLPHVLDGKFVNASFVFGENDVILEQDIKVV